MIHLLYIQQCVMYRTTIWVRLDIIVGTVTNCKKHDEMNHGSIIKGFSSPPKRPHRLWNLSSFLFNGHAWFICRVLNRPKREACHSPLSSVSIHKA